MTNLNKLQIKRVCHAENKSALCYWIHQANDLRHVYIIRLIKIMRLHKQKHQKYDILPCWEQKKWYCISA